MSKGLDNLKEIDFAKDVKPLLLKVANPARYVGNEFNSIEFKENAKLKVCLCFADLYEVGYSNLGIKILYGLLNERADTACDTCFAPWPDFGDALKDNNIPLYSLSTKKSLASFDMLGFSVSTELNYTNILYMLELAGLNFYATERTESDPIIIAGGTATLSPAPFASFFDLLVVGDGEEVMAELADLFIKNKDSGGSKKDFLKLASGLEGVYVPSVFDAELTKDKTKQVRRRVVADLDKAYYPTKWQIANVEAVHNRAMLELFRGCTRGCRFCQAGFIARPVRMRTPKKLLELSQELIRHNGYDEISLSSLSTCDYPFLKDFLSIFKPLADSSRVKISLPSTRLDSFAGDFVDDARKSSITFAPEAASQRLRDVINKNITEKEIDDALIAAFSKGYTGIKLYFMIGLPTETPEDIDAIVVLAKRIRWLYRNHATSKKSLNITVSASTFVPKPFTPFSLHAQISFYKIKEVQARLKQDLNKIGVKFSFHDAGTSKLEAALARGTKELSSVIVSAYKMGAKFDAWTEFFNYELWQKAFSDNGLSLESATGKWGDNDTLPWDFIDAGIDKRFLLAERDRAIKATVSKGCESKCLGCGINNFTGKKC